MFASNAKCQKARHLINMHEFIFLYYEILIKSVCVLGRHRFRVWVEIFHANMSRYFALTMIIQKFSRQNDSRAHSMRVWQTLQANIFPLRYSTCTKFKISAMRVIDEWKTERTTNFLFVCINDARLTFATHLCVYENTDTIKTNQCFIIN